VKPAGIGTLWCATCTPHVETGEDHIEALVRRAAEDRLPVDAGVIATARDMIAAAFTAGVEKERARIAAILVEMRDEWGETDPLVMRDALEDTLL